MIIFGDCVEKLKEMADNSVDSIVTDPPYGIRFMGKKWDYDVPTVEVWRECLRVLKPGGHALIACGTRTQHRMALNIEDAGFEIRDVITWLYGSGFPKSLDVSKAIDKAGGVEREVIGTKLGQPGYSLKKNDTADHGRGAYGKFTDSSKECAITAPATDAAKQWQGFGTALKPACEFWTLARKPIEGTVASNVQTWGVGGLNIDGCRVGFQSDSDKARVLNPVDGVQGYEHHSGAMTGGIKRMDAGSPLGRFPANLILDEEAAAALDAQTGVLKSGGTAGKSYTTDAESIFNIGLSRGGKCTADSGGASRFFYCAKSSKAERNRGLEGMPEKFTATMNDGIGGREHNPEHKSAHNQNHHPTIKPIALMRYLCRLITPPGGLVVDPFAGSGSTGVAAKLEGFKFQGIELHDEYVEIARRRIEAAL